MGYLGNQVVANISDLTRMSLADGEYGYVLSVQDPWEFVTNGAAFIIDGITVQATSLGGNTRWVRRPSANLVWRTHISDVYIDPVAGNDENRGIYTSTPGVPAPLKTWAEFARRWGRGEVVTSPQPAAETTIHVLNDMPITDGLTMLWTCGSNSFFRILGEKTTLLHAGSLDNPGGFTPWNPTGPAGGSPNIIKDSTVVTWAPFIGKRIHFTRVNSYAYILKDLGGGSARISVPQFCNEPTFDVIPTNTFPANGDAYVIEDPVIAYPSECNLNGVYDNSAFFTPFSEINLSNFTFKSATSTVVIPPLNAAANVILQFFQCVFDTRLFAAPTSQNVSVGNCRIFGVTMTADLGQTSGLNILGGAVIRTDGFPGWVQCSGGLGDTGVLDYYTTIQGGLVTICANTQVRSFSIWDAGILAGVNNEGDAILFGNKDHHIFPGPSAILDRGGIPIFGSSSNVNGFGIYISAASRVTWETSSLPNVTNGAGDFRLGLGGQERAFDTGTGAYTAPIAPTWANLANAVQFNGNAHDPLSDSHLVKAA